MEENYALVKEEKNSVSSTAWVERTVELAATCNKLLTISNACRLCSVYADKQVEYESRQVENGIWTAAGNPQVEVYRRFLFDEESVVGSFTEREEEEEEDSRAIVSQRSN